MIAGGKAIGFGPSLGDDGKPIRDSDGNPRNEFLGVSVQQVAQLTYNFDVLVKDQVGFEKKLTVAVPTATLAQGNASVPIGTLVIASFPDNAGTIAFVPPTGSSAVLNDAGGKFPWFIPDVRGVYQVGTLRMAASRFVGSSLDCFGCHEGLLSAERQDAVVEEFALWNDSAHGNHFFKFMEYDADGDYVWIKGADGKPLPAPTANPTVFWKEPGAMTTFEFGMTGAEGTHYGASCVSSDRVALWRQSGHANLALAAEEGTESGACSRCHSAQGFVQYAADTTQGSIAEVPTFQDVEPQTCAACHDSHSTTVRITGEEPVYVAAGFTVYGVGSGALCMTCHNGRRGLKGDGIALTEFRTPHAPTQAEVLMGMNAYFLGNANGFNVSGHAAVAETCVGCHMMTAVPGLRFTNTNHTFGFKDATGANAAARICADCHGEEVNGEALEQTYLAAREATTEQLEATLKAAVAGTGGFAVTPLSQLGHGAVSGTPLVVPLDDVADIGVDGTTLVFDLVAPVDVTFPTGVVSMSKLYCGAAALQDAAGAFALLDVNGVVSRTMWNLGLVNDGSKSIHNPTFVFDVLQATAAALADAAPAAACTNTCL
jgi:nitrate/TMAO reductase-like tetraheme cytochrome c subunit